MLLVLELLLFGTGLYLAATGKAAAWIAGKGYKAEGGNVRLAGVILAIPLPLAFCAGFAIGIIDPDLLGFASAIEIGAVIISAIVASVMIRNARVPEVTAEANPPVNIEPK
ncbi:MAG: hypothetical protein ACOYZ6_01825 [Chloroflexota bacterium]